MTDTDHESELKEVKRKAFKILQDVGVISAFETVLNSRYGGDDLLEEFSSPIKVVAPNTDVEPEHKDKHWEHHAYLLAGVQTIQISYFS